MDEQEQEQGAQWRRRSIVSVAMIAAALAVQDDPAGGAPAGAQGIAHTAAAVAIGDVVPIDRDAGGAAGSAQAGHLLRDGVVRGQAGQPLYRQLGAAALPGKAAHAGDGQRGAMVVTAISASAAISGK